jgi:hypothetical protein
MARRPMEAAGAVDAQNAPTAPWKTAQNAVSHSYHRHSHREPKCYPCSRLTLLPMFPVAQPRLRVRKRATSITLLQLSSIYPELNASAGLPNSRAVLSAHLPRTHPRCTTEGHPAPAEWSMNRTGNLGGRLL